MSQNHKLSLPAAVFININIMLGTGIFINTVILPKYTAGYAGLLYLGAGLIMTPLILCIAQLMRHYTEGTFYNFGATLSPYCGFINAWSYFIAKLASATLSIHVFVLFLQHIVPCLKLFSPLLLDTFLITLFVLLNTLNVRTGTLIQYGFITMKALPLLFAVTVGLTYSSLLHIGAPQEIWAGISVSLPLVLFCCLGFEASCSLSRHIKDSQINGPRAILISFATVIILAALYQTVFYSALGPILAAQKSYVDAFPLLINLATSQFFSLLNSFFSLAIATSALGGAYGILYSNSWNLYTLAHNNHLLFSDAITTLNKHAIPFWCVIIEGLVCISYLLLTFGKQIPLQYTATLGCIMSYSISVISYYYQTRSFLGLLGLASCILLLTACINGFIATSLEPLFFFGAILLTGSLMFFNQLNQQPV